MYEPTHPTRLGIVKPLITVAVISVVIVYAIAAINAQDWLWFTGTTVDAEPVRIIIVEDGQERAFQPGAPNFNRLADTVNAVIQETNNTNLINLALSEETIADYEDEGVIITIFYDRPLQFKGAFRTGEPTQILIPIEGRHADNSYFFRGARGDWWFGAMRMSDPAPLYELLQEIGYSVSLPERAG